MKPETLPQFPWSECIGATSYPDGDRWMVWALQAIHDAITTNTQVQLKVLKQLNHIAARQHITQVLSDLDRGEKD